MTCPLISKILPAFPNGSQEINGEDLTVTGEGDLPSWFAVSDLAAASIGAAGLMLARLAGSSSGNPPAVVVDRRLASFWFAWSLRPQGWQVPPPWDAVAGDYLARDGWIRLHTNAAIHRAAALSVLGEKPDRDAVGRAVATWDAEKLETAIVEAGGCAAAMHSLSDWASHPQGAAVAGEPLVAWTEHGASEPERSRVNRERPLAGFKVLDLTRVLAGPVAGRFLAAYGADVLRIDPPDWDEPAVVPEVTLGKRCAGLDLKEAGDRAAFEGLLKKADILLHGYRPGALAKLGYGAVSMRELNPALIDVCLNAYGWTGPWSGRRGFDSLVQMSAGIAEYGMSRSGAEKPVPLPVQALDHATGYLMAASVLHALQKRLRSGVVLSARLSLARVAHLLAQTRRDGLGGGLAPETAEDLDPHVEMTGWGKARRIRFPLQADDFTASWDYPAGPLRSAPPNW